MGIQHCRYGRQLTRWDRCSKVSEWKAGSYTNQSSATNISSTINTTSAHLELVHEDVPELPLVLLLPLLHNLRYCAPCTPNSPFMCQQRGCQGDQIIVVDAFGSTQLV